AGVPGEEPPVHRPALRDHGSEPGHGRAHVRAHAPAGAVDEPGRGVAPGTRERLRDLPAEAILPWHPQGARGSREAGRPLDDGRAVPDRPATLEARPCSPCDPRRLGDVERLLLAEHLSHRPARDDAAGGAHHALRPVPPGIARRHLRGDLDDRRSAPRRLPLRAARDDGEPDHDRLQVIAPNEQGGLLATASSSTSRWPGPRLCSGARPSGTATVSGTRYWHTSTAIADTEETC